MTDNGTSTGTENPEMDNGSQESPGKQVDIDSIVKSRLAQQARKYERRLAEVQSSTKEELFLELGLDADDVDEAKKKLESVFEGQSEAKKLSKKLELAERRAKESETKLSEIFQEQRRVKIRGAIADAAGDQAHTRSVIAEIEYQGGLDVDDDGNVTVKGLPLDKAVKELLTNNPHLVRASAPSGGSGGRPGPAPGGRQKHDPLTPEGRAAIARDGGFDYSVAKWSMPPRDGS